MTIGLIALIIALKVTACLISLASGFRGTLLCAKVLAGIVSQEAVPAAARVAAAGILLDRGWARRSSRRQPRKKRRPLGWRQRRGFGGGGRAGLRRGSTCIGYR
jgi:hypothetical protein